jgi:TIR domain/NNMT/PNMT/TEMT family
MAAQAADIGLMREELAVMLERANLAGHAFISYVREDSRQVDQLQRTLQAAGVPVWRDTADLWPGEDWRAKIRHAITDSALVFIACFSQASLSRGKSYQNEELTLAIEQMRLRSPENPWLIPVRLDECEIPERDIGGGRTLTSIQRADLFGDRSGGGADRLVATILRILGRDPAAAEPGRHSDQQHSTGLPAVQVPVWQEPPARKPAASQPGRTPAASGLPGPVERRAVRRSFASDAATRVRNAEAPWSDFSSDDYWRHNYEKMLPEDQEIIRRVSHFFIRAFAGRRPARRAVDIGSGTNLYPALLMLPWTEQILLTDHSASNVRWLRRHVADDASWTWQPFWQELHEREGYNRISEPRKLLREACAVEPGRAGIEQRSVFGLPRAQWQLGTMFFVAESITEDPAEFRAAIGGFVGALQPGAPFAATFMANSIGYPVAGTSFPALPITEDDVTERFTELGVRELSVDLTDTAYGVRPGYAGMIVATGIVGQ